MKRTLKFSALSLLWLLSSTTTHAQEWELKDKLRSQHQVAGDNLGISVAISDTFMLSGAWWEDSDDLGSVFTNSAGAAYFFKRNSVGDWAEAQVFNSPNPESLGYFGFACAMDGEWAFVGAYNEDIGSPDVFNAGRVYCYRYTGGSWTYTQTLTAPDVLGADYFGYALAVHGTQLIIGAYNDDEDANGLNPLDAAGSAYIFELDGSNWIFVQKLVASDRQEDSHFGRFVDIDEGRAIVGAHRSDNPSQFQFDVGSAYIFERDGSGNWQEVAALRAGDSGNFDQFGWDVAIDGDDAMVGARAESDQPGGGNSGNTGAVYYIHRDGSGTWNFEQKIYAHDFSGGDFFGGALALHNNILVVGAEGQDTDEDGNNSIGGAGSAYLFVKSGSAWEEVQKLAGSNRAANDLYGAAVDLHNDNLVVGAWLADEGSGDDAITDVGAVYVYHGTVTSAVASPRHQVDISMFPNPSFGELVIEWPVAGPFGITISDLSGKVLKTDHLESSPARLALHSLVPGMYIIEANNDEMADVKLWVKK